MSQKNYTEVLIDGTIYTLGGVEGESYLQKVAVYLNDKIGKVRQQKGFSKQSAEYQALMIELNIADDYFKEQERADLLAEQKAAMEKDAYSLKHELITTQMKLENDQAELVRLKQDGKAGKTASGADSEKLRQALEAVKAEAEEAKQELNEAKAEAEEAKQELNEAKAETEEARRELNAAKAEAEEAKQELNAVKAEAAEAKQALNVVKAEAAAAKKVRDVANAEAEEARQAWEAAEEDAQEARDALAQEQEHAQRIKQELDIVKRELEQLKAIQAAAAAVAGRQPRR